MHNSSRPPSRPRNCVLQLNLKDVDFRSNRQVTDYKLAMAYFKQNRPRVDLDKLVTVLIKNLFHTQQIQNSTTLDSKNYRISRIVYAS